MALANVAELFLQAGTDVLVIDWDLEAPGLERFFPDKLNEIIKNPGVIDMLLEYKKKMSQDSSIALQDDSPFVDLEKYIVDINSKVDENNTEWNLRLLPAGRRDGKYFSEYSYSIRSFDWHDFFQNWDGELFFEWLRRELNKMSAVVLIDSRTGVTEMGGVCVYQFADVVVMFCAPNQQNIDGTQKMAIDFTRSEVTKFRKGRSLELVVVPARVEDRSEAKLLSEFQEQFSGKFDGFLSDSTSIHLNTFWDLKIPHVPFYAFNETVAVRQGEASSDELLKSFQLLFDTLSLMPNIQDIERQDVDEIVDVVDEVVNADSRQIGLSVFSTKKTEAESWLLDAFIPPPDFEFFKGDHSVILFGEPGAGKTATCLALEQYGLYSSNRMIVHWRPQISENVTEMSTTLAMTQLHDILRSCAKTFIEKFSAEPSLLLKAAPSAQEYLIWFLKYFTDTDDLLEFLPSKISKKEKDQFQALAARFSLNLFGEQHDMVDIATEFTKAVKSAGISMVWILVDGIEWLTENQRVNAVSSLRSIFSILKLFEIPYLCYKMVLPAEIETDLVDTIAITRDRAMVSRISWDTRHLSSILEQRLSLALGDSASLTNIYNTEEILSWLETCGGMTPRGWLEYFRPIFATYWDVISNGKQRKLTKAEWISARKRSSLHLKYYPETNQIRVGMGMARLLSPEVGAIFSYLYKNQGRYCTKKELYYKAYVPFVVPEGKIKDFDEQLALLKEYDDLINTVIYRLRQAIEPNPKEKEPVFLTTKRDVGIRLSTQAFQ